MRLPFFSPPGLSHLPHLVLVALFLPLFFNSWSGAEQEAAARYTGSLACQPCHPGEYERYTEYALMSRSYQSIERLRKGLTSEEIKGCYECHTTAYGVPGGFVGIEETPHLASLSCEVCHGPGSVHVASAGQGAMRRGLTMEDCEACHISERVRAFRFKPLIYGGAH